MPQQSRLSTLLNEPKRRRVFRVAAVYGGVAFVLVTSEYTKSIKMVLLK